ncbi:thioredoxin-like domain-containing protein [uncultured Dokdonia sp.]|uniref:TlpA family protein disulfide reductase n=1 Tax=uncultured Dokdonia sp. TaxID=575653 RepID=UPI0026111FDE|nr:thioredoxin-like domain-containing protein [uncultured Dokdonia sp.]
MPKMIVRFFSLLVLSMLLIACNEQIPEEKANAKENLHLSDINLVIASETPIDSIWIADIGQKESLFLPFKDTIKVDLQRTLSDLYNVYVHTGNQRIGTQLWLNGDRLLIDMTFDNKNLTVDRVDASPLYEASLQYSKTYKALVTSETDSTTIDNFLITEIRNHIDTPFSHAIVGNYVFRNQNDRNKMDNVYRIMRMQTDSLKSHFINNNDKIKTILDEKAVQFEVYDLGDLADEKATIILEPSKKYLLDFWFVKCPPCIRDHKRMAKNYSIFEKTNIELISISRDDNYELWKNYLTKNDYPWVNVREQKPEKRLTYDLSIWEFPTYTLIDHTGSIQARFSSFAQFENYINKNNKLKSR